MKLSINNYLTTRIIKISSRICAAPKAILMLIFHDTHQNLNCSLTEGCSLTEENCSLTEGCSLAEEEQKEMEREETNTDTLPPVPPIIDTSVEDKRKEIKEEKNPPPPPARARAHTRENFSFFDQQDFSHSEENRKDVAGLNVLAGQGAEDHPTGKISVARARDGEKKKKNEEKRLFFYCTDTPPSLCGSEMQKKV